MGNTATSATHYILIGEESTFGTPVTADKDIGIIQSFNANENNSSIIVEGSSSRETQQLSVGQFNCEPSFEYLYQHGRFFEYLFGGTTVHAQSSNDWKHTFAMGNYLTGFTLESGFNKDTDVVSKYTSCYINTLEIRLELNGLIRCSATCIGQKPVNNASASSAVVSTIPVFSSYSGSLSTGTDSSEVEVTPIDSFSITFDNRLVSIEGANSRFKTDIVPGVMRITYEFTKTFDTVTEYQRFLGGTSPSSGDPTEFSLIFNANNGVSLGSGRRELNIDIATNQYESYGHAVTLNGKITQTFRGVGLAITDFFTVDNISSSNWS